MKISILFLFLWVSIFSLATLVEAMTFKEMKAIVDKIDPPNNCYRSYKAPLDLVFVFDRTSEKVRGKIPKMKKVTDLLAEEYPGSRFGMTYFADFQCNDVHPLTECRTLVAAGKHHNYDDICYRFVSGLTEDVNSIKNLPDQMTIYPSTGKGSGLAALLLAATDPNIHWSSTKQSDGHRNRILFLVTDAGTTCCHKYTVSTPIRGDGTDRCNTMQNPAPRLTGSILKDKGISVFLGLMTEEESSNFDVFEHWRTMTGVMGILAAQSNLDKDNSKKIVEVFRHFMTLIVYKHGNVPCKTASSNTVRNVKTNTKVKNRRTSPFYEKWNDDGQKISMADPTKLKKAKSKTYGEMKWEMDRARPPTCYGNYKGPLDVVFLVDRSDMEVVKTAPYLVKSQMEMINMEWPGTRFGLNYFSDFICTDWNDKSSCPRFVNANEDHMDPDGCYTFNTTLTTDRDLVSRNVGGIEWLPSVDKESGVAALMMTAADGKVGWEGTKSENRHRIVYVISNDGTHCCGKSFGTKHKPRGDGSDKCDLMDNPEAQFVGKILREKNIKLYLALRNGEDDLDVFENWNEMCQQMGVTFTMVDSEKWNNDVLLGVLQDFVVCMVYAEGEVDCPKPLPQKRGHVGYKTSDFYTLRVQSSVDGRSEVTSDKSEGRERKKTFEEMLQILENSKPPTCYRSHKNPLDVVFVIDCSAQDVLDEVPRLMKLMDDISRQYPGSRFGLTHYADFQCTDWNPKSSCSALVANFQDHEDPEGCYKFDLKLTTDVEKIKGTAENIQFLGSVNKESGLAAVLLGSVDPSIMWAPGSLTSRNKVMFVITNDATHCCGKFYNIKHLPRADGTDKCESMDNPTAEFTGEILQREGISIFMALANGGSHSDTFKNWDEMGLKMNITYGMANYAEEDNNKIFEKFKNFIVSSVYEKGPIRCPDTPKKEAPKKVSSVYLMFNAKSRPEPELTSNDLKRPPPKPKQGEKRELSYEEIAALLKTATPPECYRNPTSPLDLIFVIDHSSKDTLTKAKEVLGIVDNIQADYKGSKFGVTFYSDFICTDWTVESECPSIIQKKWDHDDPEGCYTFKYPLGTPADKIKSATDGMKILPSINTESGIAALMMTATDPQIRWPSMQMPSRIRVAFVITDDGANCCGKIFGTRNPPKGDGTDKCISMDNPTPEFAGEKLREQGISLFLAGGNDGSASDTFENWAGMANRMNVTFGVSNTDEDDNTEILRKFRQFMNKVVYFAGRVPCSMVKPSERPGRQK